MTLSLTINLDLFSYISYRWQWYMVLSTFLSLYAVLNPLPRISMFWIMSASILLVLDLVLTFSFSTSVSRPKHHYFNRLPRLWNSLPCIPIQLSYSTIMNTLKNFIFLAEFDITSNPCTFSFVCLCNKCSHLPSSVNFDVC